MSEWSNFGFITLWVLSFSVLALRYTIIAGLAFYLIQAMLLHKKEIKRLRADANSRHYMWIDIRRSLSSFFIFGALMAAIMEAQYHGYTKMYTDWNTHTGFYAAISFVLLLLIHDTYFYWMHRLLHTRILYRYIHLHHHRPTPPTPFTSFAFHPAEAVVEFIFIIPVVFLIPLHPVIIFLFANVMTAMNIWGHLGYEILPENIIKGKLGRIMNSTTHHDMHHQYNKCNYGLYFNFWDGIMRTNHMRYRQLQNRNASGINIRKP